LSRVVNRGVPWPLAVTCNVLAGAALVLLVIDPGSNLFPALLLLGPATVVLYGTALARWWRRSNRTPDKE
jgi:hypothetical protein